MKLLLSADLHLGKQSSKVTDRSYHSTIECWRRLVALAIEQPVDAVLLAGDVVDQRNKRFESYGPLSDGISRLAKAGIKTIVVSGNHDFDVLPQLTDRMAHDQFFLLGRNGKWESEVFTFGDEKLQIDGWSFPTNRVSVNPLDSYSLASQDVDLHLGMVHGDLDVTDSKYAPLTLESLKNSTPAGWLLGHIHKPELKHTEKPWVLYPGSPQAMDPGESEVHGVWLLDTSSAQAPEMLPLSSVAYYSETIDISDCDDDESIEGFVIREIKDLSRKNIDQSGVNLKVLSLRLTIKGSCHNPLQVKHDLKHLDELQVNLEGVEVGINKVTTDVRKNLDPDMFQGQKNALVKALSLLQELESGKYSSATENLLRFYNARSVKLSNNYPTLDSVNEELEPEHQVGRLKRQLADIVSVIWGQIGD